MYPYSLSIPLSAELKMPFLGTSSPACWDRTYYVKRVEFTKLAPYGASCYSSNQASFQESDPFQLVSEKSAAAKWIVLVVDVPESHANKPFIEVGRTTFCLCFWQYPKNTRDAPVCIRVLGIFSHLPGTFNCIMAKGRCKPHWFLQLDMLSQTSRERPPLVPNATERPKEFDCKLLLIYFILYKL